MRNIMRGLLIAAILSIASPCFAADALSLVNPGFEEGLKGWTLKRGDQSALAVTPEAASLGAKGLRVGTGHDISIALSSAPFAAAEGHLYRAECWAKKLGADDAGVSVKLEF